MNKFTTLDVHRGIARYPCYRDPELRGVAVLVPQINIIYIIVCKGSLQGRVLFIMVQQVEFFSGPELPS